MWWRMKGEGRKFLGVKSCLIVKFTYPCPCATNGHQNCPLPYLVIGIKRSHDMEHSSPPYL